MRPAIASWATGDDRVRPGPIRMTLAQFSYNEPNPDGTWKQCENCSFWRQSDEQCLRMPPDAVVPPDGICRRHDFGPPFPGGDGEKGLGAPQLLEPIMVGFAQPEGGSGCCNCSHGEAGGVKCLIASDNEDPDACAVVAPRGRCAAWGTRSGA